MRGVDQYVTFQRSSALMRQRTDTFRPKRNTHGHLHSGLALKRILTLFARSNGGPTYQYTLNTYTRVRAGASSVVSRSLLSPRYPFDLAVYPPLLDLSPATCFSPTPADKGSQQHPAQQKSHSEAKKNCTCRKSRLVDNSRHPDRLSQHEAVCAKLVHRPECIVWC